MTTITKHIIILASLFIVGICNANTCVAANNTAASIVSNNDVSSKIGELEKLVKTAKKKHFDTAREEATLWNARTFLGFAGWDEKNVDANIKQFLSWPTYKADAEKIAAELPNYERAEIVKMLNVSISEIKDVINGKIVRRSVPKIDWKSIKPAGNQFVSNGKPVFINDYFTKTDGFDNDYCGSTESLSMSLGNLNADGSISWSGKRIVNQDKPFSGYVLLWHGVPPKWAQSKYNGLREGSRNFTNYDIDNPHIREMWRETFKTMIPYTKGKPFTDMGYILSNEPHWFTVEKTWGTGGVSHYTLDKFRSWLKNRHKEISRLNNLWKTDFSCFDSVQFKVPFPKNLLCTPAGYDWQLFNMERVTDWFTFLHNEIKKNDPEAKTHIKLIPHHFSEDGRSHGLDFEALTELNDIIGNDAKICRKQTYTKGKEYWEGIYSYNWREVAVTYDFMKSVSPDKVNVNSESHFLSTSRYRDLYMTPEYVRSSYWLAMLHGMNVSFSWFWAREKDGSIRSDLLNYKGPDNAMANAYVASVVQQPAVANEVTRTFMDANAFSSEMAQFQNLRKPIRLFYSNATVLNHNNYMESLFNLYKKQYFDGIPLGFVTANILNKQDKSVWDVVMVKGSDCVTDTDFNALQGYLDKGGIVIIDECSLAKNEYGEARSAHLKASKGKIIKVSNDNEYVSEARNILSAKNLLPAINITEKNELNEKGCFWRVIPSKNGYIATIINLGASEASLNLSLIKDSALAIKNMMTGQKMDNNITLPSDGVLLLEIK